MREGRQKDKLGFLRKETDLCYYMPFVITSLACLFIQALVVFNIVLQ